MHYIRNQPVEDTKGSVATRNRQPLMSWREDDDELMPPAEFVHPHNNLIAGPD